jgi:hypothetical protein
MDRRTSSKEPIMKNILQTGSILVAMIASLAWTSPTADAGRSFGPASELVTVPAYETISFDIPFNGAETAVVSVTGNGRSILAIALRDADGHVASGVGAFDHQVVSMNVYRGGYLRLEIRNLGQNPDTVLIQTN